MPFWNILIRDISFHLMDKNIYSKEYKEIVEKLKSARKESGLTQLLVAEKLGVTQSYISKIEIGQLEVGIIQLKKLANLYNKKLDFFIDK